MAEQRLIEVTLDSASNLKDVNYLSRMETYAVLTFPPYVDFTTKADHHGGTNPTWKEKVGFMVPETVYKSGEGSLKVEIFTFSTLGPKFASETTIPMADISKLPVLNKPFQKKYPLKTNSGDFHGELTVYLAVDDKLPIKTGDYGEPKFPIYGHPYPAHSDQTQKYSPKPWTGSGSPVHDTITSIAPYATSPQYTQDHPFYPDASTKKTPYPKSSSPTPDYTFYNDVHAQKAPYSSSSPTPDRTSYPSSPLLYPNLPPPSPQKIAPANALEPINIQTAHPPSTFGKPSPAFLSPQNPPKFSPPPPPPPPAAAMKVPIQKASMNGGYGPYDTITHDHNMTTLSSGNLLFGGAVGKVLLTNLNRSKPSSHGSY